MNHCPVCGTHLPKRKTVRWPYPVAAAVAAAGIYSWDPPQRIQVEEIPVPRVTGTTFKIKPKKPRKPRSSAIRRPAPHILNY